MQRLKCSCKPLGGLAGFPGCYNNLLCHEILCLGCAMQPLQPNEPVAQQLRSCFRFIQIKSFPEPEEMLQLPASSRAVLAIPVGAGGLCRCLAFVFTVGQKVGKEEQSINIPTRDRCTSLTVSPFSFQTMNLTVSHLFPLSR